MSESLFLSVAGVCLVLAWGGLRAWTAWRTEQHTRRLAELAEDAHRRTFGSTQRPMKGALGYDPKRGAETPPKGAGEG